MNKELNSWLELMQRKEDLLPELQDYYEEGGNFPMVRHPLVFSVPHSQQQNAMVNYQYKMKLAEVQTALASQNFGTYLALHERAYRIDAFQEYLEYHNVSSPDYWSTLADIYTDSENIYQNFDAWCELLTADRPARFKIMSDEDFSRFSEFGDLVTIYRGYKFDDTSKWLSWSLSYKKAKFFADRFVADGHVAGAVVKKTNMIAYLNCRDEDEVIIKPEYVSDICMNLGEEL